MINRIFTFGHGQTCPVTGDDVMGRYVTVTAPDAGTARALMVATFDNKWAFEYPDAAAAGVEEFGLVEHARLSIGGAVVQVVDHGPVKPPFGTPEREADDREHARCRLCGRSGVRLQPGPGGELCDRCAEHDPSELS